MKLTPEQLHRLIDEVAELVNWKRVYFTDIEEAAFRAIGVDAGKMWCGQRAWIAYLSADDWGHAGLSAVLIMLSEGG